MVSVSLAFLSTPSARRATVFVVFAEHHHAAFLSTPSARRATRHLQRRTGGRHISIHALREEGDPVAGKIQHVVLEFLSTPLSLIHI